MTNREILTDIAKKLGNLKRPFLYLIDGFSVNREDKVVYIAKNHDPILAYACVPMGMDRIVDFGGEGIRINFPDDDTLRDIYRKFLEEYSKSKETESQWELYCHAEFKRNRQEREEFLNREAI